MWAVAFAVAKEVFYSFPDVLCLGVLLYKPFEAENCIILSDLLTKFIDSPPKGKADG